MTVADRIAIMDHGLVMQVAPPAEIYENPNSRYTADFMGDVNLIEGTVTALEDGEVNLASAQADGPIVAAQNGAPVTTGETAWLALRPEKIHISQSRPHRRKQNCLSGEVWDIAYLGDLSIYHVRLASGAIIKSAQTNQTRLVERPIGWKDQVYLSWEKDSGVVLTR